MMRRLLGLGAVAMALWIGYTVSPISECRAIAKVLDEGADAFFGVGVRWDIFNLVDCTFASQTQRDTWQAAAESYRFNATMLRQNMSGLKR